jgi:hypothetical protein
MSKTANIQQMAYSKVHQNNGWSTLEFGIAIVTLIVVITGFFDLVNLFRTRATLADVTENVADALAALPKTTGSLTFQTTVETYAAEHIQAVFPNARPNCTGDFCYRYQIQPTTQVTLNDSLKMDMSIDMPTLILSRRTLSATAERRREMNYMPSQQSQIKPLN